MFTQVAKAVIFSGREDKNEKFLVTPSYPF